MRARSAATPNRWFMTWFWARTSPLGDPFKLAFAEPMHGFIALDCPLRCGKRPPPQAGIHPALDETMILFHHVVHIFARPQHTGHREHARLLQSLERGGIRGMLVHGDDTGGERLGSLKHLAEEALRRVGIARGAQHAVQRRSCGIDGAVEVVPVLLDLDIGGTACRQRKIRRSMPPCGN